MADHDLDAIVKGASAPSAQIQHQLLQSAYNHGSASNATEQPSTVLPTLTPGDPLSHAPSSPSMIYLNMLVLEASLRAQFLELRARRRHHTFFLLLLAGWLSTFSYALFLAPREDGRGVGGSIYWGVEVVEKVCLMGGIITAALVWATGIWDRGVRWPRRWLAVANRGLRAFNCKLVLVPRPWWAEMLSTTGFFLTYGIFHHNANSSYRPVDPRLLRAVESELSGGSGGTGNTAGSGTINNKIADTILNLPVVVEDDESEVHEEDLAPGGDHVKLLLLPKPFSASFRQDWEIYRSEYWDRENERRALLRARLKAHDKTLAQGQSPWFWWIRLWLPWRPSPSEEILLSAAQQSLAAKEAHERTTIHAHPHQHHLQVAARERKRRNSSVRRGSVSSSRSQTPSLAVEWDESPMGRRIGSSTGTGPGASIGPDKRRRKAGSISSASPLGVPKGSRRPGPERSVTPDVPSPLGREVKESRETSPSPAPREDRMLRTSLARRRTDSLKGTEVRRDLMVGGDGGGELKAEAEAAAVVVAAAAAAEP